MWTWTTLDGNILVLSARMAPAIVGWLLRMPQLRRLIAGGPGREQNFLVREVVGRLAVRARRVRTFRSMGTERSYTGFLSRLGNQRFLINTAQIAPGRFTIIALRLAAGVQAETESGPGQAGLHWKLWNVLLQAGLQDAVQNSGLPADQVVRWGQPQVLPDGRIVRANKPDLSYLIDSNRWNIEIDTNPKQSARHQRNLIRTDPNSRHVFLLVDRTGKVLERRDYVPPARVGQKGRLVKATRPSDSIPLPRSRGARVLPRARPIQALSTQPVRLGAARRELEGFA